LLQLYPPDLAQSLDFEHLQKKLAKLCSSAKAKDKALQLAADLSESELEETLGETDQILALLLSEEAFPSAEHLSLSAFLNKLKVSGHQLETEHFQAIRSTNEVYSQLYRFAKNKKERLPNIWQKMSPHAPEKKISEEIDRVLDERGGVRSSASPELGKIRKQLVKSRASADRIFARALKKMKDKGYLADFDESVSEERRVFAIQAAYKGQVNGILHGSSSRQSIAFIEPAETVEINNLITELLEDEKLEIRRILKELTQIIAPYHPYLEAIEDDLVWLDFIRAKAILAKQEEACVPRINHQEKVLKLKQAYNPVLRHFNKQRDKATLPLDLELDPDQRVLVISGPNAGGKSLALKTAGLLQLMLQSGLPVPVHPESEMSLFEYLLGDIGDAQSIENELSTYSSKLQKMKEFLQLANPQTLLLVDEFGSGSDPELGSALAQVFLERLNSYGVFGVLTTHFNAIKALAAELPGVQNGAMLFDRKNFKPQYQLQVGNPGSSYTFEVARESGIPKHLIGEARKRLSENTLQIDQLLVQIQEDKMAIKHSREKQEAELKKLRDLQGQQKQRISQLEDKLQKQSRLNQEHDRLMYWGGRFQKLLDAWMEQKTQKDKKAVVSRFIAMLNQRAGEVEKKEVKSHRQANKTHQKKLAQYQESPVKIGDEIKVIDSGLKGSILEKQGDKYRVALGGNLSALLDRKQFIPADAPLGDKPKRKKRTKSFKAKGKDTASSPKKKANPKQQTPAQEKKISSKQKE
jgi:DNA mismatch repair protein MutS2